MSIIYRKQLDTDAQILCTQGASGSADTGNLNFYCANSIFNCPISCQSITMAYGGISMSSGGYGGNIGAGIVQNVGGYLTLNVMQASKFI